MMYNRNIKQGINELTLGDRIGKSGMIFIKRNHERDLDNRNIAQRQLHVDAACPFCGKVKTYRLSYLKDGKTVSCGCMRGHHPHTPPQRYVQDGYVAYDKGFPLNFGWVYDGDAGVDMYGQHVAKVHSRWAPSDKAILPIKELDPELNPEWIMSCARWARNYVEENDINLHELYGFATSDAFAQEERPKRNFKYGKIHTDKVSVRFYGSDEKWIKTLMLNQSTIAAKVCDTAYVDSNQLFGKTENCIKDCAAKYADLRTLEILGHVEMDIFEEYDSPSHSYNKPSKRDTMVELGCAQRNKGLFRISTNCHCIADRDSKTFLAIRERALDLIRENIIKNAHSSCNEHPTLVRVSTRRGVELGRAIEDHIEWSHVATISEFLA